MSIPVGTDSSRPLDDSSGSLTDASYVSATTDAERVQTDGGRRQSAWRSALGSIFSSAKLTFGMGIVAFFLLVAIFGPLVLKTDPNALSADSLQPPSAQHWLGTTQTGQDVFTQVVDGTRVSILLGFVTGLIVTVLSVVIGLAAGYFGGFIDEIISLVINVFLVIPSFVLALVLAAYLPVKGPATVGLVITITSWAWGARVLRAQTLSMRKREFVEAAKASGETTLRIIFFEILPNVVAVVAAGFVGTVIYVILAEAGLEFLGLGDVTVVSWGTMFYWANNSNALLVGAWWWFVPPGFCIAILGAALAFINFGIDELSNPRLRREPKPKKVAVEAKTVKGAA